MAFRRLHQAFKHLRSSASNRAARNDYRLPRQKYVEGLENRTLLTTLTGGQEFEYIQRLEPGDPDDGIIVRVKLEGNITVELIGAAVRGNDITLGNLPGRLTTEEGLVIDQFGGIGQGPGFQDIGGLLVTDPFNGNLPVDNLSISSIAAGNVPGQFYAINQTTGPGGGSSLQIVQLTLPPAVGGVISGTITGIVIGSIDVPAGSTDTRPVSASGADINPNTGQLFFAGTDSSGTTRLYSVNPAVANAGTPLIDEVENSLQVVGGAAAFILLPPDPDAPGGGNQDPPNIGTISFINGQIFAVLNNAPVAGGGGGGQGQNRRLIEITNGTNMGGGLITQPGQGGNQQPQGFEGADIVGLDVDANGNIIAILNDEPPTGTGGGAPQEPEGSVLRIGTDAQGDPVPGNTLNLGTLAKTSASAMAFVPGITDVFTGNTSGAFIGFDDTTDTFFYINTLDRGPAQTLWNVYVTSSDLTGKISIGYVFDAGSPRPNPDPIRPFDGDIGDVRVIPAQGGLPIIIGAPANSGQVLIGALTFNTVENTTDEEKNAFGVQPVPQDVSFGALPSNVTELASGLVVAEGQDLGKFLFGGTLLGQVDARRNLDFFYAGWLLTGSTNNPGPGGFGSGMGQSEGLPLVPDNFRVDGDLRSLVTLGSIGGNGVGGATPQFVTGFDLQVGGSVGTVRTYDAFYGKAEVNNLENRGAAFQIRQNQLESEFHNPGGEAGFEDFEFGPSGGPTFMYNDTFDTAEYLGSITSSELNGRSNVIRLNGTLQKTPNLADIADYYAVSLMAGQSITVRVREQLTTIPPDLVDTDGDGDVDSDDFAGEVVGGAEDPDPLGLLSLGVFDPDGRLVATDYNNLRFELTNQQYITFTADRPGVYRFAVAASLDAPGFNGAGPNVGVVPYTLTALKTGDIALGGLVAASTIYDMSSPLESIPGINLFRGDIGAVKSLAGDIVSDSALMIRPDNGNLRTMDAVNIGAAYTNSPTIEAPRGSVGLVRASGGALLLNQLQPAASVVPIGGDYQLVDGPLATVLVTLRANRAIGVIRAGDMASPTPSILEVNADDTGRDGVIDLIDVTGDMGTFPAGGPGIMTNTGGNVRYIRVGGTPYRDAFFGNTGAETTNGIPGQPVTITDDSGSQIRFASAGTAIRNPFYDPAFPNAGILEFIGSRISLITYPIRGSGGSVVINATSESGMSIDVSGGASAEIGRVEIAGLGRAVLNGTIQNDPAEDSLDGVQVVANDVVADPDSPTGTRQSLVLDPRELTADVVPIDFARMSPDDFFLRIGGSGVVDVLSVIAINNGAHENLDEDGNVEALPLGDTDAARPVALGNPISITNSTGGELVNVVAATIGELSAKGNLGLARSTTGTVVEGSLPLSVGDSLVPRTATAPRPSRGPAAVGDAQPFLGMREGIAINGNVITIRSGKAIGNVVISGGSVGEIIANADGENDPNQFEGINGTIYAAVGGTAITSLPGRVNRVRIGEGILPSGTGNFQQAGIVAEGIIGPVSGQNADIRGDLIAMNTYRVIETTTVEETVDGVTTTTRTINNPSHTPIERITLENGSIINADIFATSDAGDSREFVAVVAPEFSTNENFLEPDYEIGTIRVSGNGGIIGTRIGGADVNSIVVDDSGYGIFTSRIDTTGDGTLAKIQAGGYGLRGVDIVAARVGEITANGDGTSLSTNAVNERVRYSEIAETDPQLTPLDPFFGFESNALTDVHVNLGTSAVQGEISGVTETGVIESVVATGQRDLRSVRAWQIRGQSRFDFGNSVGSLNVRDIINGLELTTGSLKNFTLARDAFALTVSVSGKVKKIDIKGSLAGNSVIRTFGDGGQFDNVSIKGNLIGNITSSRAIKSISIGGDFTGNVTVNSGGTAIKTMKVGGSFIAGSLDIVGNVGTLQTAGSLGSLGDTLTINGSVSKLVVGGDLRANVKVTNNLKTLQVKGSIVDGGIENGLVIDVDNILTSLQVGGDIQQGVKVEAKAIKKQKIGGQNLGEFVLA